jgi:transposase
MQAVLLVRRGWSTRAVARHLGYNQSAIVQWVARAPSDGRETIPTLRSRPKSHSKQLPEEVVAAIVEERLRSKRCAEVIHQALAEKGVMVSLSSVKRTLARNELLKSRTKWKRKRLFVERLQVVQTDNGAEFQIWFRDQLKAKGVTLRHSRVRQSNDNAHVERFNRTLQDECLGRWPLEHTVPKQLKACLPYYKPRTDAPRHCTQKTSRAAGAALLNT